MDIDASPSRTSFPPPAVDDPLLAQEGRLLSLDAISGAVILCFIGLVAFAHTLGNVFSGNALCETLARQFSHTPWEGLTAYDIVFPAFVFISGVAMSFSFEKRRRAGVGNLGMAGTLLCRALILIALGAILQGALTFDFAGTRWASVLGLIGGANLLGGLIALFLKTPQKIALATIGVSLCLAAVQILGGDFTPAGTLNAKLDALLLPGKFYCDGFDPEGIFCVFSASVPVLVGYTVGLLLQARNEASGAKTSLALAGAGALAVCAALVAGGFYPIVKNIWTQTFVWAATGWSALVFAAFYWFFDVLKAGKVAFFFKVIGVNALAIYVLQWIFPFENLSALLFSGVGSLCGNAGALVVVAGAIALKWLLLYRLSRRGIFYKI